MTGPDERARREQNGDRRYGQTDLSASTVPKMTQ